MIHTLLNLTRPLFVLDSETTGLNDDTARIIELGFQMWTAEGMVKEYRSLINPMIAIPPESTAIHGITDEMMLQCQTCKKVREDCGCEQFKIVPTFKQLAPSLARGFTNCDYAGKNIRFDLRKMAKEFGRAGVKWDYIGARIIDIDRNEAIADPRDLGSMHKKATGEVHEGAHGALSDVKASHTVLVWQFTRDDKLPRDIDELHNLSWPGWIVADGSFRFVNGKATVTFGKHRDTPMDKVPTDYWDWMLGPKVSFPDDVRALVLKAKLGQFPVCTVEEATAADKRMNHAE